MTTRRYDVAPVTSTRGDPSHHSGSFPTLPTSAIHAVSALLHVLQVAGDGGGMTAACFWVVKGLFDLPTVLHMLAGPLWPDQLCLTACLALC